MTLHYTYWNSAIKERDEKSLSIHVVTLNFIAWASSEKQTFSYNWKPKTVAYTTKMKAMMMNAFSLLLVVALISGIRSQSIPRCKELLGQFGRKEHPHFWECCWYSGYCQRDLCWFCWIQVSLLLYIYAKFAPYIVVSMSLELVAQSIPIIK